MIERRAGEARRRRLQLVAYLLVCALGVYNAFAVRAAINRIQQERSRSTRSSCEASNAQNAAIRGFVTDSVPAGKLTRPKDPLKKAPYSKDPAINGYLVRLVATFPSVDCDELVKQRVSAR